MQDPLIGRRLANFVIESVLGRGGMAQVYFGRDINLQRAVAIKVIDARYRHDPAYATRFINEARAVASWRHENIVQVYYASEEDGLYYFVMEYINGMDLASLLRQYAIEGNLMPHDDVLRIAKAVASALDYAHSKGVIHRDVKPANVMIALDDRVVLTDFGLALDMQQGSVGEVFGSPHYISPEQARRSADATAASDLYSLGVMLYEMLTGTVPFDDPSPAALGLQHLTLPPPPPRTLNPDLNEATEQVLLKALSKEPSERYRSAASLIQALDEALKRPTVESAPAELPPMPAQAAPISTGLTVAERIALHARYTRTEFMPNPPRIPSTQEHRRRGPEVQAIPAVPNTVAAPPPRATERKTQLSLWLAAGIMALVVIGGALLIAAALSGSGGEHETVAAIPTATPTLFVENTATTQPPTTAAAILSTASTVLPEVVTVQPTALPILPTVPPPSSPPVTPTDTLTVVSTATSALLQPTILYPNGRRIEFLWDASSFYWHNPQGDSLRVSSIRFEAVDSGNQPIALVFDGSRWAGVGYNLVESGKCSAVEVNRASSYLRPAQCTNYNSIVNATRDTELVFWTPRDGITQFRVLWEGQEVGRCDMSAGRCEVYLP